MDKTRKSGVLLHITSLPNEFSIGDLGDSAYNFVDALHMADQRLWQILPLNATDYYGSPYMPYSTFAGNQNLISPRKLLLEGLIEQMDINSAKNSGADGKDLLLEKAYRQFTNRSGQHQQDYKLFCILNQHWLPDYALFMALKNHFGNLPWIKWPEDIANYRPRAIASWHQKLLTQVHKHKFIQYIFDKQWQELYTYAKSKSIAFIGDLPIFVAYDSSDVWSNSNLFLLGDDKKPLAVAGVPPDYFSKTGQLWGNPVYDWQAHQKENFSWWIQRFKKLLDFVDIIRIDHFRGFESYWQIPFGSRNAVVGSWQQAPGNELFSTVKASLGSLPFIAEDLGVIDEKVVNLLERWRFPGMKVLQFAFEGLEPNSHSPHEHTKNSIVYTGTHDNNTTVGWYENASDKVRQYTCKYLGASGKDIAWDFIRCALASPANMAVIPLQDILSLGSQARMNTPGTIKGNWRWRLNLSSLSEPVLNRLAEMTVLYGR